MLRTFFARNYRNLQFGDLPLKFERINLLIGPNNSGKSNFMKALGFIRDLLVCDPAPTAFLHTADSHGRAAAMNRAEMAKHPKIQDRRENYIGFWWLLDSATSSVIPLDLSYSFAYYVGDYDSFPSGCYLLHEGIQRLLKNDAFDKNSSNSKPLFSAICHSGGENGKGEFTKVKSHAFDPQPQKIILPVDANETVLRQTKSLLKNKDFYENYFPDFERASDELLAFARGFRTYSSTELDLRKLAEGAKIDLSVKTLDGEGSQFINVLRYLDQKHDFLEPYVEHVRELIKDLKRIKVVDASDTQKQLDLDIGGHKYRPREMSDGTLKALWLALLLFSPVQQSLLAIDEPELNLHPAWIKVIGSWLLRFCSAEQLFVSTHSPDLLDTFTEGFKSGQVALFVFESPEKGIRRIEAPALSEFFQEGWELGDLYRVGEPKLGGWPW